MRKLFKDFFIHLIVAMIVETVLPVLTALLTDNITTVIVAFVIVSVLTLVFVIVLYKVTRDPSKYEIINKNKTSMRYSIAFVDNDLMDRRTRLEESFERYFHGYDILFLKTVNDARLLAAFDIVILDYLDASDNRDNTSHIFKDISKLYPEKYVVAMSINSSICSEIVKRGEANSTLPKPIREGKLDVEQWMKDVDREIQSAFDQLDNPKVYWNKIEEKQKTNQERTLALDRYILFLESHSNFKMKKFFLL